MNFRLLPVVALLYLIDCTASSAQISNPQPPGGPISSSTLSSQGQATVPMASINPITTVKMPAIANPVSTVNMPVPFGALSTSTTAANAPALSTSPKPTTNAPILPPGSKMIAPTLNTVTSPPLSLSNPTGVGQGPAGLNQPRIQATPTMLGALNSAASSAPSPMPQGSQPTSQSAVPGAPNGSTSQTSGSAAGVNGAAH